MTDQERYHSARRDPRLVLLEGFHAIKHALRFHASIVDMVTDAPDHLQDLARDLAPDLADAFSRARTTANAIDSLTPTPPRTRTLAIAARPVIDPATVFATGDGGRIVVLDTPRHPGNIGAAIRVAAAAGAAGVFTTGDADPWSPAAVRGAAGLQFALPVGRLTGNGLPATTRDIIAIHPEGDEHAPPADNAVLVFGSERDGIGSDLLDASHRRLRIPMREGVSSLNLATAVAVMLYRGR